jgi:hypothetical protein
MDTKEFTIPISRLAAAIDNLLNDDISAPDFAFALIVVPTRGNRIGGQAAVVANIDGDGTLELIAQTTTQMSAARDKDAH